MNESELQAILDKHKKWLKGEEGGERASLQSADLQDASLQSADLQDASLEYADLRGASLQSADLQEASLQRADLQGASLQSADLRGADLDFSCWPLWCGSFNVKVDDRIFSQLLNHVLALDHPGARELRKLKTVVKWTEHHKASREGWAGDE